LENKKLKPIIPESDFLYLLTMDKNSLRAEKESLLGQKAISIWFTGLSGSGKTTLAYEIQKSLTSLGFLSKVLDGDNIRKGLNNDLGFSEADRYENIRRVAEISKLFAENGIITICAFICPLAKMRKLAKSIIGGQNFVLVYLDASFEACENRDIKGLYAKARKGEIKYFTGLTGKYEKPDDSDLILDTVNQNVETCIEKLTEFILQRMDTFKIAD
jgi:adenylylsulfate kinase